MSCLTQFVINSGLCNGGPYSQALVDGNWGNYFIICNVTLKKVLYKSELSDISFPGALSFIMNNSDKFVHSQHDR